MDCTEEMTDKALRSLDNEVATILTLILRACPMALGVHAGAPVEAGTLRSLLNGFLVGQDTMAPLTYRVLKVALDNVLNVPPPVDVVIVDDGGDGGGGNCGDGGGGNGGDGGGGNGGDGGGGNGGDGGGDSGDGDDALAVDPLQMKVAKLQLKPKKGRKSGGGL